MFRRPLLLVLGLSGADYLAWTWSLAHGPQVLGLICGLALVPLLIALALLAGAGLVRLLANRLRGRTPAEGTGGRSAPSVRESRLFVRPGRLLGVGASRASDLQQARTLARRRGLAPRVLSNVRLARPSGAAAKAMRLGSRGTRAGRRTGRAAPTPVSGAGAGAGAQPQGGQRASSSNRLVA